MKKHKNKLTVAALIFAILAAAWFFGGNYNKRDYTAPSATARTAKITAEADNTAPAAQVSGDTAAEAAPSPKVSAEFPETVSPSEAPAEPADVSSLPELATAPPATPASAPTMEIDPATGTDRYLTAPVPEGKPAPVEPQDVIAGDGSFSVTFSVDCDTILNNMNLLSKEKYELVPGDGVIFPAAVVTAYEGESVFNLLQREMKRARIHMEFRNTPLYNSAYIMDIGNLYEFDAGELSGWMYKVNGWFPNYGCSRYQLQPNDIVEWHYTCDLGRDLGEYWRGGGQLDE